MFEELEIAVLKRDLPEHGLIFDSKMLIFSFSKA
jgi:hypothetical protein